MKKSSTAKFLNVMKICAAQGMIAVLVTGMTMAHDNYAQLLDRPVSVHLAGVSFEKALDEIAAAVKVKFVYSADQLKGQEEVTLDADSEPLRDVLDKLLTTRSIRYKIHEKEGAITLRKQGGNSDKDETGLKNPLKPPHEAMQITGTITDGTSGQPIAGVNVVIKGTTTGTTTDIYGQYTVEAGAGDVLVFSFIGFATVEVRVDGRAVIDVPLQEDVKGLKEVVINGGYYSTTRMTQAANIAKVEMKDIEKQPVSNPLATLAGRVPGLEITQQSGIPGSNFTVRLRGQNSIGSGNDPLFIVDGVPFTSTSLAFPETSGELLPGGTSPLNYINPNDIESIEVLKDAAATAIYGSRGANGVILITTKKGKAGKTQLDVRIYFGVSKIGHFVDLLSTEQYLTMRNEAFSNDSSPKTTSDAVDLLLWDTTAHTDWQKELIGGSAHTTDAQVSFSGGDKFTQFIVSSGFHKETTVYPGDYEDWRISTRLTLNNRSADEKLKSTFSINHSLLHTDLLGIDLTGLALTLVPLAPRLYDDDGNLNWENYTWTNPLSYLAKSYSANTSNLIANALVAYELLPGLDVKVNSGYTRTEMRAIALTPNRFYGPPEVAQTIQHQSYFANSSFRNWILEPQLQWKKLLGIGSLDALVGGSLFQQETDGSSVAAVGFVNESLMKNLGAATTLNPNTNYSNEYKYSAVFGRINYTLKDKYIVDVTGRRDGSSRFGPGRRLANFGAAAVAWIFSNEEFIKEDLPFVSFGKLRISYGTSGNDQIGDYEYLDTYSTSPLYMGNPALSPVRLFNAEFAWEVNKKLEMGFEWGVLKDRITGSLSYYRNHSSNQLIGTTLPPTTGFTLIRSNFPANVQNTGVELLLNTTNVKGKDFTWSTSLNFTIPHNKLVEFPDLANSSYANAYVVGKALSVMKVYSFRGLNSQTGVYEVEDVNGDGLYNQTDKTVVKFTGTEYFGGMQNSFQFKGFQFDILMQIVKQTSYNYWPGTPGAMINQHVSVMQRWTKPEDASGIQRFGTQSTVNTPYFRYGASEEGFGDLSFVRIKSAALSYSIPETWKQRLRVQETRLFLQGQNLITFTNYIGLDPESGSVSTLPPLRTITVGASITF